MAFSWKDKKDVWKGEGIYFLTFVIRGRQKLLGSLVPIEDSRSYPEYSRSYQRNVQRSDITSGKQNRKYTSHVATVELTPFGFAVSRHLQELETRIEGLRLCAKQIQPDHIHAVIWIRKDTGKSIRQIGNGFRIGIKNIAIEMGIWSQEQGHILETPFIRTLAHAGQLRSMIDYTHANHDNAWARKQNPELYTIRRNIQLEGLAFDGMGKDRLLAYPDRQVIALSRSLTQSQIANEVAKAIHLAESGTVTYTAAINEGEKAVSKAVREACFPLVVMMLDGFPPEGTEAAHYFHPNGIYHRICGEGKLMLLAPHPTNYHNPALIALTEQELSRKATAKGQHYTGIPHDSKRWRMIAGNVMLKMIADQRSQVATPISRPHPLNFPSIKGTFNIPNPSQELQTIQI